MRTLASIGTVAVVITALAGATVSAQRPGGPGQGRGGPGRGGGPGAPAFDLVGPCAPQGPGAPDTSAAGMRGDRQPPFATLLGLSADQMQRLAAIHENTCASSQPLMQQREALQRELHDAVFADAPNQQAALSLASQIAGLDGELMSLHVRGEMDAAATLTPEQRAKLR